MDSPPKQVPRLASEPLPVRMLNEYDISDDRKRTRVFKMLRDLGDRVQYSVFCCQLNDRELHRMKENLAGRIDRESDQALVLDAGPVDRQRPEPEAEYIGRRWEPEPRSQVV